MSLDYAINSYEQMGYISDAEATSTKAYEAAKTAMEGGAEVSEEA